MFILDPRAKTEFVEANGLSFEVLTCGEGDRLALCLHGFPEHAISWRHQLPALTDLGFRVWAPNLRGYGKSSRPKGVKSYCLDNLVADVAGLIDASGAREVVLLAHDWGAAIAWEFAYRQVRPLSKLVIMNVPHPACFMKGVKTLKQLRKSWYIFFFQIPFLPEYLLGRKGAKAVGDAFARTSCDRDRFPDDLLAVYSANATQPGALKAMINYYRAAYRYHKWPDPEDFPIIDTPTLLVWGEEDMALGKELTIDTDQFVSNLTTRYLTGVSHWVQQEAPNSVNAMVDAFLNDKHVPQHSELRQAEDEKRSGQR